MWTPVQNLRHHKTAQTIAYGLSCGLSREYTPTISIFQRDPVIEFFVQIKGGVASIKFRLLFLLLLVLGTVLIGHVFIWKFFYYFDFVFFWLGGAKIILHRPVPGKERAMVSTNLEVLPTSLYSDAELLQK